MSDSLRAFISLPVADEVVRAIVRYQQELARGMDKDWVRWTSEDQIHLTLKFLGNVAIADVEALKSSMPKMSQPLRLRAEGLGGFPSRRNPRVLWIGLTGDLEPLKALQGAIADAAAPYCARDENREFHPHLTIGRLRETAERHARKIGTSLEAAKDKHFGDWESREFLLMQSKLSPKGATHSVLARFGLRAAQP